MSTLPQQNKNDQFGDRQRGHKARRFISVSYALAIAYSVACIYKPDMDLAAALAAVESATARAFSTFFFEYRTLKVVQIGNRKIGVLNRTIQLVIIGFIIGCGVFAEASVSECHGVVASFAGQRDKCLLVSISYSMLWGHSMEHFRVCWVCFCATLSSACHL